MTASPEKFQLGVTIPPVSEGIHRPFWSVMIPTYNRVQYLEQTLKSVLEQDPEPEVMQIEVIDNCSTQVDVKTIVEEIGKGRVSFYRQTQNIGMIANWDTCIKRARGRWIHILHDDDLVLPRFYSRLQEALANDLTVGAAFCRHIYINEEGQQLGLSELERETSGVLDGWLERIAVRQRIQCASIVVRRSVYEQLGGFCSDACSAADWEMWKRIAVNYPMWFEAEPLACYRLHSLSDSTNLIRSGRKYSDIHRAIEISELYLPKTKASELSSQAREFYALEAINTAHQTLALGDISSAIALIENTLKCSDSSKVLESIASLLTIHSSEQILNLLASLSLPTELEQFLTSMSSGKESYRGVRLNTLLQVESTMSINETLAHIKNLPEDWHTGGALSVNVLEAIVKHVEAHEILHSVETGSGASTLLLSHISNDHKVFSYDCGSNGLTVVKSSSLLNKTTVDFIEGPTQKTIPQYNFKKKIQLALIDGPHGYPFPDLEYYFIYPHLEKDALLILDDIWIPTIYNLFKFLKEDEMFELIEIVEKTAFFRRTDAPLLNPVADDWFLQNYNKKRFPVTSFKEKYFPQAPKTGKKTALVFFPHNPYPPRTGAHQRCLSILGGLKELGYELTLFGSTLMTDNPWPSEQSTLQYLQEKLGVRVEVYQGTQADGQFMALSKASRELINWDFYTPPGLQESFRQLFRQLSPEIVVINYALWGQLAIGEEFKSALRIIDTIDLYTLNIKMRQALGQYLTAAPINPEQVDPSVVAEDFYSKLQLKAEPSEYWIFDQYDYTIAIASGEAQSIGQHTHHTKVEYIPMTFTTELVNNTYTKAPVFAVGPNPFNVQGYLYFANKVLPLIRSQLSEFKLQVVGSICQQLFPTDGIELLGFVPDLKPLYAESPFAICPLIGGTGQQVKIVEAMAHGVPVIALQNVAKSSPIEHGVNGFIAENAEEFAEYTIRLYRDRELCGRLGQAARETIAQKFSQELLVEKFKPIVAQVPEKSKSVISAATGKDTSPLVLIDNVFFQLYQTGIARVWRSLLEEWAETGFAKHVIVLDRAGTSPKIPGIYYRRVPRYDYSNTDTDREMLQQICDEESADLFISTYYTTPTTTPSVFMAYDMIPEVIGWDLNNPMWREKHHAIAQASAYMAISENTARDLVKYFPDISPESITVALCGVKSTFSPTSITEVNNFKNKYGISKPYFMVVGTGGYKNTILFLRAFAKLHSRQGFEIVCTSSSGLVADEWRAYTSGSVVHPLKLNDDEWRAYTSGSVVHLLKLNDDELRAAYSGAVALVYPSKYEGFGLPVLEAMACGCPVITCPNASIPEVVGEAALYVNDDDVDGMANALCEVQKPDVRRSLTAAGLEQAKKFSWSKMANTVSSALVDATLLPLNLKDINVVIFPDWSQPEELLGIKLEQVIRAIATHPNKNNITLLVDTSGISDEDANLLLSGAAMNLLMQEDLDVSEGVEISLVGTLSEIQWEALLPHLQGRISLEQENQEAIAQAPVDNLPTYELDKFSEQPEQFFLPK